MTIEILGDYIADLAEAGGRRDADVFAQVMEAFQYSETHACIESLQLARPLQRLLATGGDGPSLIIDGISGECGGRKPGRPDHGEKVKRPACDHSGEPLLLLETRTIVKVPTSQQRSPPAYGVTRCVGAKTSLHLIGHKTSLSVVDQNLIASGRKFRSILLQGNPG